MYDFFLFSNITTPYHIARNPPNSLDLFAMALRGVWQLRELAIRYSLEGGSSRGVRAFVEDGLVEFARKNPQIAITTKLEPGHPNVHGKYITGYEKNLSLKNMDKDDVGSRIQYLRDTLGRKTRKHNQMWYVNRDFVSVTGFPVNTREIGLRELPAITKRREQVTEEYGLNKVVYDIGVSGMARVLTKLQDRQAKAKQLALERLPKKDRVLPTE